MTRTTSQGLTVYETGDPATVILAGMPTGDSTDAAIARIGAVAATGGTGAAEALETANDALAQSAAPVSPDRTTFAVASKNLVDPSQVLPGFTLNTTTGQPSALATYSLTGFVAVVAGQSYTVSNARNVCYYSAAKVHLGSPFNNTTSAPATITPTTTGYIRASFVTASYGASFQIEKGAVQTGYEPYGVTIPSLQLSASSLAAGPVSLNRAGDLIAVTTKIGTSTLTVNATLNRTDTNGGLNINTTTLDGAVIHGAAPGDEVTPLRTQLGTVGANHGYATAAASFTNPDLKTTADLGSVWTDGTRQYVLIAITGGKLIMGGSYTVASGIVTVAAIAPAGDLTHVAGATRTGTVAAATKAAVSLFPSVARMRVTVFCDGAQVIANGDTKGARVEVRESYEVLDWADLYDQAKANVGVSYTTLPIAGAVRVSNVYVFTAGGRCRVRCELTAMKPTTFGTCGFLQSVRLTKAGTTVTRFVPGVAPISGVDFAAGVDLDTYSTNLVATTSTLLTAGVPPSFSLDRMVEAGSTRIGFALGYLPYTVDDSNNANRIVATPTNLWDLRGTDKSYPTVLNAKTLQPGSRITCEGFRSYLSPAQTDAVVSAGKDALGAWAALDSVAALSGAI